MSSVSFAFLPLHPQHSLWRRPGKTLGDGVSAHFALQSCSSKITRSVVYPKSALPSSDAGPNEGFHRAAKSVCKAVLRGKRIVFRYLDLTADSKSTVSRLPFTSALSWKLAAVMTVFVAGMNFTCLADSLSNFEFPQKECFLTILAKALGYIIIIASTIVKLPQILIIVKNNSIRGLSIPSFELECVGYTVALSYCLFKRVPFSAYGELVFLLIQAIILMTLLYWYSPRLGLWSWIKIGLFFAVAPIFLTGRVDPQILEALYNGQTALFTISRIPQIWTNYSSKNTGQLSFSTSFMSFAGCVARLFTSIQEQAPLSMVVGSVLGLCTHGTLVFQIAAYNLLPGRDTETKKTN